VERATVLEGADFIEKHSGGSGTGGAATGVGGTTGPTGSTASGSVARSDLVGAAGSAASYLSQGQIDDATQAARAMSTPSYDALLGGALKGIDARTLGIMGAASTAGFDIPSIAEAAGLAMGSTADQIAAAAGDWRLAYLESLQDAAPTWQLQLGPVAGSFERMVASLHEAYTQPLADLSASMGGFQEGLRESLSAMQEAMSQYDLSGLESQATILGTIRDVSPETFRAPVDASLLALFDQQAQTWLGMSGQEFIARYEAGELPADEDDPDEPKKIRALVALIPYVRKAA